MGIAWNFTGSGASGLGKAPVCRRRIGRQALRVARKDDAGRKETLAQQAGGLERIAAIVARAGQNEDRAFALDSQFGGQGGGRSAGSLHQWCGGVCSFDPAQARAAVDGRGHGLVQAVADCP